MRREKIAARTGWEQIPAVRAGQLYEIKSAYILQPGPAALTEGVGQIQRIVNAWHQSILDAGRPADAEGN